MYLDFSAASMAVAQKRVKMRGLTDIRWINDRIENIPQLNIGQYSNVKCGFNSGIDIVTSNYSIS